MQEEMKHMKITDVRVGKLYSFGPEQRLEGLTNFNLFIGKNATGKTNMFKILEGLPFGFEMENLLLNDFNPITGEKKTEIKQLFKPSFIPLHNEVSNIETRSSKLPGILEINYKTITSTAQNAATPETIRFRDDKNGHLAYEKGNIPRYTDYVKNVKAPESDLEFFKDLASFFGYSAKHYLPILNFGLFYIFGFQYRFGESGTFLAGKNIPSGVRNASKLLLRFFMAQDTSVVLMDEPEVHLEPRTIRRFFSFLVWLSVRAKEQRHPIEDKIYSQVEEILLQCTSDDNSQYGEIVAPEGNPWKQRQLFVATHSPILINEFLQLGNAATIFSFRNEELPFEKYTEGGPVFNNYETKSVTGTFSTIHKIDSHPCLLLNELGCKGSDLLQCNGIVWVEGPSDVIYIRKWIEMYANQFSLLQFKQGKHYEFQMFGGALLDSLCLSEESNIEAEAQKLVSMFSFSMNAFVIIDSDTVIDNKSGNKFDQSKFTNAKKYIRQQFDELEQYGYKLGMWYKEGDDKIRTIEDYLDSESVESAPKSLTKKLKAARITDNWGNDKNLDDFSYDLKNEIENLYNIIQSWNE